MLSNPNISETFVHADGTDMTWHLFCQEPFILWPSISHVHPKNVPNTHHFLYHIPRVILSNVGPKEVEGFNCCMFCWPSPVLGPSTNGTKREKPMEKPNGASTIQNQHAPPESQWFQGRQFRVALCIYRITYTCCGYIYIYIQYIYIYIYGGWWNVTVHKMGIRMKQPVFHGMTSWHLQI